MNIAVILAAGSSKRFEGQNKIFLPLNGEPVLAATVRAFTGHPKINRTLVVIKKGDKKAEEIINETGKKNIYVIAGSDTRQKSSYAAINWLGGKFNTKDHDKTTVLIHNSGNPYVTKKEITDCLKTLRQKGVEACGVGRPVAKTVKEIDNKGYVKCTPDRTTLWEMETPQCANLATWKKAFDFAKKHKIQATDDLSLVEALGGTVKIIKASPQNRKITDIYDFYGITGAPRALKLGFAEDSHGFSRSHRAVGNRKALILGGIKIPNEKSLMGDSDADVILHAIAMSFLSAIGEKTFGELATPMFKSGESRSEKYLEKVLEKVKTAGEIPCQINIMIEASHPKMSRHLPRIRKSISKLTDVDERCIGIQIHTGDELTPFGKGEGIRVSALTTLAA